MNEIKFIVRFFAISLILVCTIQNNLWSRNIYSPSASTHVTTEDLKQRLQEISTDMDMRYTAEVHKLINRFISKYRNDSEILLARSSTYFPIYHTELEKAGLPAELKYLSVVESSLRPTVVSRVGAVGLWQFMKSTGKMYGLTINSAVDERRDAIRSTQAATAFLKELHEEFGDWSLALAAYNCGPGGVKKAKRRSVADDDAEFWDIKSYLPKETRKYVPKFIAISYVMNYFHMHGLEPAHTVKKASQKYATARIHEYTTFTSLSKELGISKRQLWKLNPAFLKGYIPKSSKGYLLTLPEDKMYEYLAIHDKMDNLEYRPSISDNEIYQMYLYGSMKRSLRSTDLLKSVPTTGSLLIKSSKPKSPMPVELPEREKDDEGISNSSQERYTYYKLKSQQSLQDVAEMLDISLAEIILINEIDINNPPAAGSMIKVAI